MNPTKTAFGMWSGGRFMHFGNPIDDTRYDALMRLAYESGVRTFMTADVYGAGQADEMCARGLAGLPRDSYCLVGAVGHDFYEGERAGAKGFPRFTNPDLRGPSEYGAFLRMATEKSLERCGTDHFDLLLLHNPDKTGYTHDKVWEGMRDLKDQGLARSLGIAPGPANGFTLDLALNFERFSEVIDWAMIILNPMEPWPGSMALPPAREFGVELITRVVDCGGLFHDDVKPGHEFAEKDHRTFRPAGWVESGNAKLDAMRPYAEKYGLTMLQLACAWNLSQKPVGCVVPTVIEEVKGKAIEEKVRELATLPETELSAEDIEAIRQIGDNTGCMALKGGSVEHEGDPVADRWALDHDLLAMGEKWRIDPARDLVQLH